MIYFILFFFGGGFATQTPSLRSKLTGNMDRDTAEIVYRLQELNKTFLKSGNFSGHLQEVMGVRGNRVSNVVLKGANELP